MFCPGCRKQDVDRMGSDIAGMSMIAVTDVNDCASRCTNLPECKAWTFRASDVKCWLKNSAPPETPNVGLWSGIKDC